jgi:hypothetical protein
MGLLAALARRSPDIFLWLAATNLPDADIRPSAAGYTRVLPHLLRRSVPLRQLLAPAQLHLYGSDPGEVVVRPGADVICCCHPAPSS